MSDKFDVEIVYTIYTLKENENKEMVMSCGFIENNNNFYLPSKKLTSDKKAAEVILEIAKNLIGTRVKNVDIIQVGFFDPLFVKNERIITLAYKTILPPAFPIYDNIKFFDFDEIREIPIPKERDRIVSRKGFSI